MNYYNPCRLSKDRDLEWSYFVDKTDHITCPLCLLHHRFIYSIENVEAMEVELKFWSNECWKGLRNHIDVSIVASGCEPNTYELIIKTRLCLLLDEDVPNVQRRIFFVHLESERYHFGRHPILYITLAAFILNFEKLIVNPSRWTGTKIPMLFLLMP